MVHVVADRLTIQRAESSSEFISLVDQPLPPSPKPSLEQYYSDSDSDSKRPPANSAQQKIANTNKMSRVSNALPQAAQIKSQLNGPDNWVEWNRNLNSILAIANLWKVLTVDKSPSSDADDETYIICEDNQESLNSVLFLICGPSALSIIEKEKDASATQKYQLLKAEYDGQILVTFSDLYQKISRCNISNHKSLKEYGEKVTKAQNKLVELGEALPEMFVFCAFLDGLDSSYNAWKNMFFLSYYKAIKNKDEKMVQPTIEEILKLLIDQQTGQDNGAGSSKSKPRAFKAKQG